MTQFQRLTPSIARALVASEPTGRRIFIEDVYPSVDQGRFPVKRIVDESVEVWADIFRDGHEVLAAAVRWHRRGHRAWQIASLRLYDNDRWRGSFQPPGVGRYVFTIEAWTDIFGSWRRDYLLKKKAGRAGAADLAEGRRLLVELRPLSHESARLVDAAAAEFDRDGGEDVLLREDLAEALRCCERRPDFARSAPFPLLVERERARFGSWYEIFPRSQGREPGRHGTLRDCIDRVPEISELGFDVLYLPPIHPIGRTNRKGRNNTLTAGADDPGSTYAIGSAEGGHDAIHPQLGTIEDFRALVAACTEHGMELALDFAVQCSPDHPWLRQHPEWFTWQPDGTVRYAENPPKTYEDIVNPDLYCGDRAALWAALRDVLLYWGNEGVRIFRVDNPHTKAFPFWEWIIEEVQLIRPDTVFLSEAFTRPKVMKALAKLGFSQSYTYFTWRSTKDELSEYLSEIARYPEREYFRPNFFVNTPDILPLHLQSGDRWMFMARAALAATLSSNWGVYNGFELLEHEALPDREEYRDSEKYEIKVRDWHALGNIRDYIAGLNQARRVHPALRQTPDLRFVALDSPDVIGFVKQSADRSEALAVAIALTGERREPWFHFGDLKIGPAGAETSVVAVEDIATGERRRIEWGGLRLAIEPQRDPCVLLRCLGPERP